MSEEAQTAADATVFDEEEKGSRSPYSRIRNSFVAKFGSLLSTSKPGGPEENAQGERRASHRLSLRRKSAAPKAPAVDPADLEEIRTLVKECEDPSSRRGALLGLFKISLKENVLEALVREGAVEALILGLNQEAKGSGARRAAMQTLRNLAAHSPNHQFLMDAAVPTVATVLADEDSGSPVREAALEALSHLSANPKICSKLMAAENIVVAVLGSAMKEPAGTQGREFALAILERMTQSTAPAVSVSQPPRPAPGKSGKSLSRTSIAKLEVQEEVDEEEGAEAFDVQLIIDTCVEVATKEAKGSAAKRIAVRILRNLSSSKYRVAVAGTRGLYDGMLSVAAQDGPGSETRWLVFALFSDLSGDERNVAQIMKTNSLVDTVITAVRDEPTGSPAREYAMLTVARLSRDPKHRQSFLKGGADGLISVCVRASTQEAAGSGGRAAALELCAALALAPETQDVLFKAPGLVNLAIESALNEKAERVRIAGLDLIASLAGSSESNRTAIFKMKHASEAVLKAVTQTEHTELQGAGIASLRSFSRSPGIQSQLRKATLGNVIEAARSSRSASRAKIEAIACLDEGLFDNWNDAKLSYEVVEVCAAALKNDAASPDIKAHACSLLTKACKHKQHGVVMQSGVANTLVTIVRNFTEMVNQSLTGAGKPELYSRASLRRAPISKHTMATPEEMAINCSLALKLLAHLARLDQPIEGVVGACLSLLKVSEEELLPEGKSRLDTNALDLATLVSVLGLRSTPSTAATAKDMANTVATRALDRFLPYLVAQPDGDISVVDVLEVLYTLSCYHNCVATYFEPVLEPLMQVICEKAQNSEDSRFLFLVCSTLLNCLFVSGLGDKVKISERRSTLDQTLSRIAQRGGEDAAFAAAGRAAQGTLIGLKIINSQATVTRTTTKEKRMCILAAADGLLLAKHAEDVIKKVKGFHPAIEEAEWFSDKWEKIPIKQRKIHVDSLVTHLTSAHGVVVCSSKGAEADPVIRMLAEYALNIGIPVTVCTGVETTSPVCWGTWLEEFKSNSDVKDVNSLSEMLK